MKTRIAALIAAFTTGTLLALGPIVVEAEATPGDPHADTRACVDNREVAGLHERLGRTELERRWEVTGLGQPLMSPIGEIVAYPWCDHPGLPDAYLGVFYSKHRRAVAVVWWDCTWPGNVCAATPVPTTA